MCCRACLIASSCHYQFVSPNCLTSRPRNGQFSMVGVWETYDLPPERMADVFALKRQHGRLTANDCLCLVTTQCHEGGILLTGDSLLRKVAAEVGIKVHGVLWIIKEFTAADACDDALLIRALKIWKDDATVFLPKSEIEQQLRVLQDLKHR